MKIFLYDWRTGEKKDFGLIKSVDVDIDDASSTIEVLIRLSVECFTYNQLTSSLNYKLDPHASFSFEQDWDERDWDWDERTDELEIIEVVLAPENDFEKHILECQDWFFQKDIGSLRLLSKFSRFE